VNDPGKNPPGTTIVIADDEAPIRLVVGDKLRSAGFTVHDAKDGEEALDLVRAHLPAAVITDLQMPYMNGLELCTAIRADPRTAHIPALLLTARGHVLSDEMLAATNIRRVMSKPFGVRDLLAYVQDGLLKPAGDGAVQAGLAKLGAAPASTPAASPRRSEAA
jgi:CheY-like chemotaxis protein